MEKIPLPNTPAGKEFRKNKIGSSDAPIIMGVSPWASARDLYKLKKGDIEEKPITEAMQRGITLEPVARKAFEEIVGFEFPAACALHSHEKWLLSSADGWCEVEKQVLEIKIPGRKDHEMGLAGFVPEKYIPQLQHHMNVWGTDFIWYYTWNETSDNLFKYYRDDRYIKKMVGKEREFYDRLCNFNPPEDDQEPFQEMNSIEWETLLMQYKTAEEQEKSHQLEKDRIKALIIELASQKNSKGGGFVLNKYERKGNIDFKKIPELKGKNLDEFRSPSTTYWRISEEKDSYLR